MSEEKKARLEELINIVRLSNEPDETNKSVGTLSQLITSYMNDRTMKKGHHPISSASIFVDFLSWQQGTEEPVLYPTSVAATEFFKVLKTKLNKTRKADGTYYLMDSSSAERITESKYEYGKTLINSQNTRSKKLIEERKEASRVKKEKEAQQKNQDKSQEEKD